MNAHQRFVLLASIVLFGNCIANSTSAETINVSEYANLNIGYGWNYQQSLYSGPWTVEVDSLSIENGYQVIVLQEYDSSGFKNDQHYIRSDLTSGMFAVGGLDDYGQATQNKFSWTPPAPILLRDFVPGQPNSFSTVWSGMAGSLLNGSLTITKETVSVPAGTFVDTWRASQSFNGIGFQTWWYAKGVGLVKREQDDGNIWELTSVSGFTSPVPEPASIWLLSSAVGVIFIRSRKQFVIQDNLRMT